MSRYLTFLAGTSALTTLMKEGLHPNLVETVAAAAGGPKGLILTQLDRVIFPWLQERNHPLFLLGSSIGSWRLAAGAQKDPGRAIARLEEGYIQQKYSDYPSPEEVSDGGRKVLDAFMDNGRAQEILNHPWFRLNIVAARCRSFLRSDHKALLFPGLFAATAANAFHRRWLGAFLERTIFSDSRDSGPFLESKHFPNKVIPLRHEWVKPALLASGSIPIAMSVAEVPGSPKAKYRDGGLVDYHMNVPFSEHTDKIVLHPHFNENIVPGWLDKYLPWGRKPNPAYLHNVLLVCPSKAFVEKLAMKKIPDRTDFVTFLHQDEERIRVWRNVVQECERLREELHDVIQSGKIAEVVRPFGHAIQ